MSDLNAEVVPSVTSDNTSPARRCPDYDEECIGVPDHYYCWRHGNPPCAGYCPFLMGMEKR